MKKTFTTTIVLMVSLLFASCEKCFEDDCVLIPAKIIRYDCDRVIFQLLTSELIGDAVWQDAVSGNSYNNVVSYYNTCKINEMTNGSNGTLYVRVKKTNAKLPNGSCYQCLALAPNPPKTKVDFIEIEKGPCGTIMD